MDEEITEERIRDHQRTILREFRNPEFRYFEQRFGRAVPDSLKRLYELKEGLFNSQPFACDYGGDHPLWIQNFSPLSIASVDYCEQFRFESYVFARGPDGESLHLKFGSGRPTFVSWDDEISWDKYEGSLAPIGVSFDLVVERIVQDPPPDFDISHL